MLKLHLQLVLVALRQHLTKELVASKFRRPHPMAGHCYHASEALFHLWGGKAGGWTSMRITHEGVSHWYLQHEVGIVVDPTVDQFTAAPNYARGHGCGFLTKKPSKKAAVLLNRLKIYASQTSLRPAKDHSARLQPAVARRRSQCRDRLRPGNDEGSGGRKAARRLPRA